MKDSIYKHKDLDFAIQDRASSLSPIFQHVGTATRPALKHEREYDGLSVLFTGFEVPGVPEQSILLACLALANIAKNENGKKAFLPADPKGQIGRNLATGISGMGSHDAFGYGPPVVVETTIYRLLKVAGLGNSKQNRSKLETWLIRLASISYFVKTKNADGTTKQLFSQKLLSFDMTTADDKIYLAVNSMFASAFTGQHSRIDLAERREIGHKNGIALLLHSYFSSVINKGQAHAFNVDKLVCKFVAESLDEVTPAKKRKHRANFRNAVLSLAELEGWSVSEKGSSGNLVMTVKRK